jgi:hypothetical protein
VEKKEKRKKQSIHVLYNKTFRSMQSNESEKLMEFQNFTNTWPYWVLHCQGSLQRAGTHGMQLSDFIIACFQYQEPLLGKKSKNRFCLIISLD